MSFSRKLLGTLVRPVPSKSGVKFSILVFLLLKAEQPVRVCNKLFIEVNAN